MDLDVNIKSDTADKAIDLLDNSSKKSREALDSGLSRGINKLFDLIKSTPLGIKAEVYIQERPYKLQLAMESMKKKYEQIPEQNRIEPTAYIALKGINELNYSLDEEHLKEMFENLLVSDMDNRKQNKVLPAYIEIVKQLSKDDAIFLKKVSNRNTDSFAVDIIKYDISPTGSVPIGKELIISKNEIISLNDIVIDNLERLNILKLFEHKYFTNSTLYDTCFNEIKSKYHNPGPLQLELTYEKSLLQITEFGKNFIDICLS